jgi:ABC-2 type transport system permease protein
MSNTITIWRKELQSYFRSPIAYGVMAFFALITGYFFYVGVVYFVRASVQSSMMGQSQPMSVNESVIRPLLGNVSVIGLFLIPMITMRLFAEEKRSGTIELLVTSPIKDLAIIMGKWLAALTLYAAMLGLSLISMVTLFFYGKPDVRPMVAGYLGLMLWVLDWMSSFQDSVSGKILSYLSVLQHFDSFSKGVIDSRDVIYYLSAIFIGLFLTARSLESMRWRA